MKLELPKDVPCARRGGAGEGAPILRQQQRHPQRTFLPAHHRMPAGRARKHTPWAPARVHALPHLRRVAARAGSGQHVMSAAWAGKQVTTNKIMTAAIPAPTPLCSCMHRGLKVQDVHACAAGADQAAAARLTNAKHARLLVPGAHWQHVAHRRNALPSLLLCLQQ